MQAELASALGLHYLCGKIRIMARKKANYPLIEGLEITTLAAEGKAMGRWNDVVVFVPLTVPGRYAPNAAGSWRDSSSAM